MMNTRRQFLKKVGTGAIALAALPLLNSPLVSAADLPGSKLASGNSSALPADSWDLHYAGKVSRLVLKKDASGKLTGTLSGQPVSLTWNEKERSISFAGKLDPSMSSELQVFTGVLLEISGTTKRYLAGWAKGSNIAQGVGNNPISPWFAQ